MTQPTHTYSLETLATDQDRDLVCDTIAPLLAWIHQTHPNQGPPFEFELLVERIVGVPASAELLRVNWDIAKLEQLFPNVTSTTKRLASGRSALHEDVAKLAAYCLALTAISVFMPGTRVKGYNFYAAPDLLFDQTPGFLKGVEVAGRGTGGQSALNTARNGGKKPKQPQLQARTDIAEVHLALWCISPRCGLFAKVKP